ncbi:MAG: type II secretion system F family protein [Candidatus Eremiobacteraeota bacterium]|nr:type II secretion system F family protein [Candidatus Eremiobacteraeota bacterium]MCW5868631.1 type II secretion system F family protein [Candidatus Eremiobacteraeota bacterium]
MPYFQYVGLNSQGREVKGRLLAETIADARNLLEKRQYRIQSLEETRPLGQRIERWLTSFRSVSLIELAFNTRQFALMANAGIPVSRCLEFLANQPLSGQLQEAWVEVERRVTTGHALSQSLKRFPMVFSDYYVGMVYAGETSGNFHECLDRVALVLEKEAATKAKVRAALSYPAAILTLGTVLTLAICQWILPQLTASLFTQTGMVLPWPTVVLMKVTHLLNQPMVMPALAGTFFVIGFLGLNYLRTPAGKESLETTLLKIPGLQKVMGKVMATQFCRTFSSLIRVGVPLTKCLQVCSAVMANSVMQKHLQRLEAHVMDGGKMHEGIREIPFFPRLTASFMELGEDTGRVSESLDKLAEIFEEELDADLEAYTALLEPIAMGALGLFVLFVILAVFLPLNTMLGSMG